MKKNAQRLIKDSGELSGYLRHKRLVAKYSLTEPEERIINTLDVTGATALVKLYENRMKFCIGVKNLIQVFDH